MKTSNAGKNIVPIALVDDDRVFRIFVAGVLNAATAWRVVLETDSVDEAVHRGEKVQPKVALLDLGLTRKTSADSIGRFLQLWPGVRVVMLTAPENDDHVLESIRDGACGYLRKGATAEEVSMAVEDALADRAPMSPAIARRVLTLLRGVPPVQGTAEVTDETGKRAEKRSERVSAGVTMPLLTRREHEVLAGVVAGLGDQEIAHQLGTAGSTVKNHLANIYAKWRVRSRTEAAVKLPKIARE